MNEEKYVELLEDGELYDYIIDLEKRNKELKLKNDKAIKVYDETINYLTTINSEFIDRNTKLTIKEMIKNLEKELNILQGSDKE